MMVTPSSHSGCDNQQNQTVLGGEVHKRSSSACRDDEASSEVSTELEDYALRLLEPNSRAWPAPRENFTIFDWNDTLLPTTWLREQGLLEGYALSSAEQDAQLQVLANLVAATLDVAKTRGGVAIVTNAEQDWVELSCLAFMPSLQGHLEGVRIVSARTHHEKHGIFAPTMWKCFAFDDVVGEFYDTPDNTGMPLRRCNIISLGDSEHEMEALKWIAAGTECCVKTLKFVQSPSLEQLVEQHELVAGCLTNIVDHDGNLEYEIGVEDS